MSAYFDAAYFDPAYFDVDDGGVVFPRHATATVEVPERPYATVTVPDPTREVQP